MHQKYSGAGGNTGNSISTSGINEGNSGNVGGSGKIGISGKLNKRIFAQIDGGSGKLGKSGKATFTGKKLNSGNIISNQRSMLEKSNVISGNLKFGIWIIGSWILSHKKDNLQEYWSYVSLAQLPHLLDQSTEKSIINW